MNNIELFKAQVAVCNQIDWNKLNTLGTPYEPKAEYAAPDKNRLIGVSQRSSGSWKAYITTRPGKQVSLGTFVQRWDAICARKSAEAAKRS